MWMAHWNRLRSVLPLLSVRQHWHLLLHMASPQFSDRKGGNKTAFIVLNLWASCTGSTTPVVGSGCEHINRWPHSCWVSVTPVGVKGHVFKVSNRREISNWCICISLFFTFIYRTNWAGHVGIQTSSCKKCCQLRLQTFLRTVTIFIYFYVTIFMYDYRHERKIILITLFICDLQTNLWSDFENQIRD